MIELLIQAIAAIGILIWGGILAFNFVRGRIAASQTPPGTLAPQDGWLDRDRHTLLDIAARCQADGRDTAVAKCYDLINELKPVATAKKG